MLRRALFAAFAAWTGVFAFAAETPATSTARKFVVGFDADFKPYGYKEGNEYRGFDLDLARAICARKGWEFVANPINWDSKDFELNSGSIDCIWNGFTMQGRENAYTWSRPYVDNSQVVMVKTGADIQKLGDLAGKRVGVQTDTPVWKALKAGGEQEALGRTFKDLVVMPNYNQAVQELAMGGVDAVALDVGVARAKMADKPGEFRLLPEVVMSETYGIGFKLGNTTLRDEVEAELAVLATNGVMDRLAGAYGIEKKSLIFAKNQAKTKPAAPAARKFVVGFDADFKPYGYKEGNEYRGFDLDLARAICARKGWEFVANPINWDSKDFELNSGSIDCIWNGFTMQGRENAYTWSRPYVDNSQVVMVKTGADIQKLGDLAGKRVGVQTDTPVWKALKAGGEQEALGRTFKDLVVMPNYNQAVQELAMGGVDAVALDVGVARAKMADKPGEFRLLPEVVMSETYGIGFKLGNTTLRDEVEAELAVLATNGVMDRLAGAYGIEKKSLIFTRGAEKKEAKAEPAASANALPFVEMIKDLLGGLLVSLEIFFLTLVFALPLGFVVAFGRMAKNPIVSAVFQAYISIVRGTPLMLQILFVYFAPYYLFGASLAHYPRLVATILAFSLNYAAYFAEIYRGGILSIDYGQREAAKALGLDPVQTFFRIILPQTIKRVIPAVGNEVITLVKDTSLAFTIAVTEMFTIARQLSSAHTTMAPLIAAGVFYYLFNFVVAWTLSRVEKHYDYYR